MYEKTRLMTYEKERITTMLNKNYTTSSKDVYTANLETTSYDAHKLIMIVTRNTVDGCISQKYTLLSSLAESRKTVGEITKDFSPSIGQLYYNMLVFLQPKSGGAITTQISLINMLGLGKSIIEEINGSESIRTVPINVYDLSCNSFSSLPSNYAFMNSKIENGSMMDKRERSIIRIIDDYIRSKDVGLGKKMKKR